nr:hypothetical protein [Hyphomonas sp. 34-62-18]
MFRHLPSWPWLALAFGLALAVLCAVIGAKLFGKASFDMLTRDMAAMAEVHPLTGLLSHLGLMVWSAGAAVCFLGAVYLYRANEPGVGFFFWGSALTTWLLFDDAFMIHETLANWYLGLGEKAVIFALGLAVSLWLYVYRKLLIALGPFFLIAALAMFALSVGVDAFPEEMFPLSYLGDWRLLLEDGAKWIGIVLWLTFQIQALLSFLERAPASRNVSA